MFVGRVDGASRARARERACVYKGAAYGARVYGSYLSERPSALRRARTCAVVRTGAILSAPSIVDPSNEPLQLSKTLHQNESPIKQFCK